MSEEATQSTLGQDDQASADQARLGLIYEQLAKRSKSHDSSTEATKRWREAEQLSPATRVPCLSAVKIGNRVAIFLGVFFVFWTFSVICIGGAMLHGMIGQLVASSWVPVPATIETSKYVPRSGGNSTARLEVTFRFELDGKSYVGNRIDNAGFSIDSRSLLAERMSKYPVGAKVTAYVNPSDPSRAILDRSMPRTLIDGVLFLLPFICVGVLIARLLWRQLFSRSAQPRDGQTPVDESEGAIRITVPQISMTTLLIISFGAWCVLVLIADVLFTLIGRTPSLQEKVALYLAGIPAMAAIYLYRRWVLKSGRCDVLIDARAGEMVIPSRLPQRSQGAIRIDSVLAIAIDGLGAPDEARKQSMGAEVMVVTSQGALTAARLTDVLQAKRLGVLLAEKLDVAQQGARGARSASGPREQARKP